MSWTILYILSVSLIFSCFSSCLIYSLKADGEIKVSSLISIICLCINISLDYIFIVYLQLGLNATTIASLISFACETILSSLYVHFNHSLTINFSLLKHLKINWKFIYDWIKFCSNPLLMVVSNIIWLSIFNAQLTYLCGVFLVNDDNEYFLVLLGVISPFYNFFNNLLNNLAKNITQTYSYNVVFNDPLRIRKLY